MKKILIISPVLFYPPNEGNKARIFNFIKKLKLFNYEIHYFYTSPIFDNTELNEMGKYVKEIYKIKFNKTTIINFFPKVKKYLLKKINMFYHKFKGYYKIDSMYNFEIHKEIKKNMMNQDFDYVLVEYVFLSKALESFDKSVIKIIDTHDIFSDRGELFKKNGYHHSWFHTNKKNESIGLNRADIIISIQNKENIFFRKLTSKPVITIGHDIELQKFKPTTTVNAKKYLLFVGSSNQVNQNAISYFLMNSYPILKKKYNENICLMLIGSICNFVTEENKNIIKLGVIDSLNEYYDKADIVINPVQFGTGLKIKNIEALAYSKALITTPIGAEGIEQGINKSFLVAKTANDFTFLIVKLLENNNFRNEIEKSAHLFMKKYIKENNLNFENLFFNNKNMDNI